MDTHRHLDRGMLAQVAVKLQGWFENKEASNRRVS
jgi:hypothetical protein